MAKVTFGKSVLQVEGLEVKYDIVPVSSSLARLIGDKDSASIVQQLYYWLEQGYGEVIEGVRWIYKPVKEWIEEVFPTYTSYQLGKMMKQLSDRGIIRREKLFTKHQIQRGDRFWWQPKNQTYYYSLNYEKLQELADNYQTTQTPETSENPVFLKTQILSNSDLEHTKNSDCSKNNTDITSIENNSTDKSHPHLPCEWNNHKENNQKINLGPKGYSSAFNPQVAQPEQVNSFNSTVTEPDINTEQVEQKVNQYKYTNDHEERAEVEKPQLKISKGNRPKRESKAPWKNQEQFKAFYRALIQAIPIVANARSPQGLAQTIIRQLRSGNPHTYWDDFAAGLPIGSSTKPEWEIEPGVPYPMFIEYLTEKLKAGNNTKTDEQTRNEVFSILEKPRQAKAFWGQFKRSVVNVSEQVSRDRALGVSNPNTPVWTREKIEPSIEEAAEAGDKIMAVNGPTQAILESADALAICEAVSFRNPLGKTPQLESKDSPQVPKSPSPQVPHFPASTSQKKLNEVSPPSDPWSDRPTDNDCEHDEPQTMREMLAERGVKGFCTDRALNKTMPKVTKAEAEAEAKAALKDTASHKSEAIQRQQMNRKTHISQMSLAEINELIKDSILRAQLTPQLIDSDYELITDELGQIIRVELSELQKREKLRQERERS